MKILHVLNGLNVGGAEAFLKSVVCSLEKDNVETDFLLRSQNNNDNTIAFFENKGCKIFTVSSFPKHFLKNRKETAKFLKSNRNAYDAVHIHANSLFYFLPIILVKKYIPKCKIIVHSHNTSSPSRLVRGIHLINKLRLKNTQCIRLACSREAGEWMYGKSDFKIINNAVNLKDFQNSWEEHSCLQKKYKMKEKNLICVGRLEKQKNHLFLIPVIKKLVENYPELKLLICGDGSLKAEIANAVSKNCLDNNIKLLGDSMNVPELLKASDIYLMPSLYEGLSIAAIEAQATGIPCILSDTVSTQTKICPNVSLLALDCDLWIKEIEKLLVSGKFEYGNSSLIESAGFGLQGLRQQMKEVYFIGE